ncbi:hypothetical protein ABEV34_27570 [Methylorubrum rhodesianum]|uniref:hypothetical protein n=1 Tax=Methylorubrum TaxID=2282523 RepID=UPI0017C00F7C|nr:MULTISPECIES: hypothetical protein [Methylorubrum]MBB5765905.1 hypothetical protein [Methylorubrum rhodesianum]
MTPMPRPRPPHLNRETTRHGTVVWYVRRGDGPRIRIRGEYGSPAFQAAYEAAVRGRPAPEAKPSTVGTVAWLVERYLTSRQWSEELSAATRAQRHGLLKAMVEIAGHERADAITRRAIQEGMDRRKAKPHGANNWVKTMRGLFAWAVDSEMVPADPTRGVKLMSGANDRNGFHSWTEEEVARFEAHWPSAPASVSRSTSCSTPACVGVMRPGLAGPMSATALPASSPRRRAKR